MQIIAATINETKSCFTTKIHKTKIVTAIVTKQRLFILLYFNLMRVNETAAAEKEKPTS